MQRQKDALKDTLDAYKDIIDAQKEKLRLQKEEDEYQKDLKNKNKEIANIDRQLLALQFDNSQEANAKRLQLEEERAKKTEELAEYQADRTYDIAVEALDREYAAFEDSINKQMDAIDDMIDKYRDMIDVLNDVIEKLRQMQSSSSGSSGSSGSGGAHPGWVYRGTKNGPGTGSAWYNAELGQWHFNANDDYAWHSGGMVSTQGNPEVHHDGGFAGGLHANEVYAKLLEGEYVANEAQMSDFIGTTMPKIAEVIANNMMGSYGDTFDVNIVIPVEGNLDGITVDKLKKEISSTLLEIMQQRGKKTNVRNFSL